MVAVFGQKAWLGQENGPDIELVVSGTEFYATYETGEGYPAVYDENLGLFCYARVVAGRFESTNVPVSEPPPEGVVLHAREADSIRAEKVRERENQMERRSNPARRKQE